MSWVLFFYFFVFLPLLFVNLLFILFLLQVGMLLRRLSKLCAQGTTEYLIILSIVIVFALIVVAYFSGNLFPRSESISLEQNKNFWRSQDIALYDAGLDENGDTFFMIKNNTRQTITLTGYRLNGVKKSFSGALPSLKPGEKKIIFIARQDACDGSVCNYSDFAILYTSKYGLDKYSNSNDLLIEKVPNITRLNFSSNTLVCANNDEVGVCNVQSLEDLNAAGSSGEIQFNNNGAFGADENFYWDANYDRLGIGTKNPKSQIDVAGNNGSSLLVSNGSIDLNGGAFNLNDGVFSLTNGYFNVPYASFIPTSLSSDLLLYLPFNWSLMSSRGHGEVFSRSDSASGSTATFSFKGGQIYSTNNYSNVPRFEPMKVGMGVWIENVRRNLLTYSSFESGGTPPTGWTNNGLVTATTISSYPLHLSYSANLVSGGSVGQLYRAVTLTNGDSYPFFCHAMLVPSGAVDGAIDSSVVTLYAGAPIDTNYVPIGNGWYKLTGNVVGTGSAVNYGVQLQPNQNIVVDACQIESNNSNRGVPYSTTYIANTTSVYYRGEETLGYYVWRGLGGSQRSADRLIYPHKGTISFWFKPDWSTGEPNTDNYFVEVPNVVRLYYSYSDQKFYAQLYDGSSWTNASISIPTNFVKGNEHYVSFRWNSSSGLKLYVDGNYASNSVTWTPQWEQITTDSLLYVGSKSTTGGRADSLIGDFAIFNRDLSDNEVNAIYYSKAPINDYQRSDNVLLQYNYRAYQPGSIRITGEMYSGSVNTPLVVTSNLSIGYSVLPYPTNLGAHTIFHLPFSNKVVDGSRREVGTFIRNDADNGSAVRGNEHTHKYEGVDANVPRIDSGFVSNTVSFDASAAPGNFGIWIEESRKNVALNSSFEEGDPPTNWIAQTGCTASQTTSQEIHGDYSVNITSTGVCRYYQSIDFTGAAVKHQITAYVWRNESSAWGGPIDSTIASLYASAGLTSNALSTVYTYMGNGWHRLVSEFTPNGGNYYVGVYLPSAGRNIFVDAIQVERKGDDSAAYFPSTYIPTATVAKTRAKEGLYYDLPESFNSAKGFFSVWFKPYWTNAISGDNDDKYFFYIPGVMRVRLDGVNNRLAVEHWGGTSWVLTAYTTTSVIKYYWNHLVCGWYYNSNFCMLNNSYFYSSVSWTPQSVDGKKIYIGSDENMNNQFNGQLFGFIFADTSIYNSQSRQLYYNNGMVEDYHRLDLLNLIDSNSTSVTSGSVAINGFVRAGPGSELVPTHSFSFDKNSGLFSPSIGSLGFSTNGVEALRVDRDGRVGIGTTSPVQKLDVNAVMHLNPIDSPGACDSGVRGSVYYDDSMNEPCFCNGSAWVQFDGGGNCT